MKIQSAGQQKYQDLIRKPAERVRTAMIVWISLACLAFISFFSNVWVALILAAAAAVLAARNIGARRVLEGALDGIEDREDFFCQLMEGNTMEFPGYPVVVTREYLVTAYQTVWFTGWKRSRRLEGRTEKDIVSRKGKSKRRNP